jgi:hypothetical protein
MIDRNHIEKILKINGKSPSDPDDVIRSVLLSARYSKDEVDTALMVLRENSTTKQMRVEGLHKVFRTDNALRPQEISELLGIDVDITNYNPEQVSANRGGLVSVIIILFASIFLALTGVLLFMYTNSVGFFYPEM